MLMEIGGVLPALDGDGAFCAYRLGLLLTVSSCVPTLPVGMKEHGRVFIATARGQLPTPGLGHTDTLSGTALYRGHRLCLIREAGRTTLQAV